MNHIAIETTDIDRVPEILTAAGVPFRQNVSVPKGTMQSGAGTNSSNNSNKIVRQFFLRDPDGYYLEICDCAVLTKYCLGDIQDLDTSAASAPGRPTSAEVVIILSRWVRHVWSHSFQFRSKWGHLWSLAARVEPSSAETAQLVLRPISADTGPRT